MSSASKVNSTLDKSAKPDSLENTFTLLGFAIEKDEEGKEVLSPSTFTDTTGTEHTASRKAIVTAIESKIAFEGYSIAPQQ